MEKQRASDPLVALQNSDGYLPNQLIRPRSPYEVKAGTIIPTVLVTGINSDLPGTILGQVRENVYDTVSGNHLLIPQGSKVLASYDSPLGTSLVRPIRGVSRSYQSASPETVPETADRTRAHRKIRQMAYWQADDKRRSIATAFRHENSCAGSRR